MDSWSFSLALDASWFFDFFLPCGLSFDSFVLLILLASKQETNKHVSSFNLLKKDGTVLSGYSDTLWNLNLSRYQISVAGIIKWFWVTIEGYLCYLLTKFEGLVLTSLGSGAIETCWKCVTATADYCMR